MTKQDLNALYDTVIDTVMESYPQLETDDTLSPNDYLVIARTDGLITHDEFITLRDANKPAPVVAVPPRLFNKNKFEKARSRFRIGTLGETEKDAYTRYHRETSGLHPAVIHVGPDGRYYAFGNRKKAVALIARQTKWI